MDPPARTSRLRAHRRALARRRSGRHRRTDIDRADGLIPGIRRTRRRAFRPAWRPAASRLGDADVLGAWSLRALSALERHRLALAELVETRAGAGGLVKEVL